MEVVFREGRSLEETPTWSVATVTTVMVFVCLFVERSIYRFGTWLKKTRRKALYASVEKIKEELMLLGLISLLLGQCARQISQICVNSSLFSSKFYLCSQEDYDSTSHLSRSSILSNHTDIPPKGIYQPSHSHQCGEGREPFVSYEGLEQLHRFLFVLGITHVLYSCIAVGLAMTKIYSWRKWENQVSSGAENNIQGLCSWLLWGYAIICIFINIHGLNVYFWLSFVPAILVMLVGTKLQHVVSLLALEIAEPKGPVSGAQVKPRDGLFWFGKPKILLRLIQFISFQNAFEMATFIWSLWGLEQRACFMKNHAMVVIRLISGVVVQFWCSHSTVPLNVIISQMGSRCGKALVAESVRDSLHSWCKRVKDRSKRDALRSITTRSTCSLGSIIDEGDEIATVTLSPCSSRGSFHHLDENVVSNEDCIVETSNQPQHELSFRNREYSSEALVTDTEEIVDDEVTDIEDNMDNDDANKPETLFELFQKT
ncbi:hypothetical protein RND71_042322 [Anisodus tanguticus]|uniref:MLO-like protein n=1 Tax=Anisodus tanguticus TaxID=243964 RepID=A0AAE1QQF6_9SOLA|nr:hypothetical protein RND71_042322 [Anisodus tanguticus]